MRSILFGLGGLLISLCLFSPRLILIYRGLVEGPDAVSGHFEWARGTTFQEQCQAPFSVPREPAMRWRLLPPVICHYLGLTGNLALLFPWIGVLCLLVAAATTFRRSMQQDSDAFFATTLVAMSSAVVVPTAWLGINDSWYALALLGLTHWSNMFGVMMCAATGCWIDERFLIAFPIAFFARRQCRRAGGNLDDSKRFLMTTLPMVSMYVAIRLLAARSGAGDQSSGRFVQDVVPQSLVWAPWVPLGLWMGWRAGWGVLADVGKSMAATAGHLEQALALASTVASMGVVTVLAADSTRNATLMFPWISTGLLLASTVPGRVRRLAVLTMLIPMCNVTYTKVSLSSPMPLEAIRLILRRDLEAKP